MSLLDQTLVLYVVVGVAVAAAVYLTSDGAAGVERWFRVATAIPFWPLYVPLLLARGAASSETKPPAPLAAPRDALASIIGQVDAELETALGSLDGWAEGVLARERGRIHELRAAWTVQADRIRDMDRLLGLPEYVETTGNGSSLTAIPLDAELSPPASDRLRQSLEVRRQNLSRLRRVRQRAYDDLLGTLAWVRELVSMIHLAKFTGAPAARAEELVAQIAAAVEGLSELTWKDEPTAVVGGGT
jgi:hypothetical protein